MLTIHIDIQLTPHRQPPSQVAVATLEVARVGVLEVVGGEHRLIDGISLLILKHRQVGLHSL